MVNSTENGLSDGYTRHELYPWLNVRASFAESRSFWLLVGVVVLSGLLFTARDAPAVLVNSLAGVVLVGYVVALHVFLRSSMTLAALFGVFLLVIVLMTVPLVPVPGEKGLQAPMWLWFWFWRDFLPGNALAQHGPFPQAWLNSFLSNFLSAGVAEDTFKLAPVGIFILLSQWLRRRADQGNVSAAVWAARFDMSRPTTVLMTAFAAAAAFVYVETVYLYVPQAQANAAPIALQAMAGSGIDPDTATAIARGFVGYKGVELLVPRLLSFLMGHGAYAAIVAYGVILAQRRPKQWPIALGSAVLLSAFVHGSWNTFANLLLILPISFAGGYILLAICARVAGLDHESGYAPAEIVGESIVSARRRATSAPPAPEVYQARPLLPAAAEPLALQPPPSQVVGALTVQLKGSRPRTVLLQRAAVLTFTEEAKSDPTLEAVLIEVVADPNNPRRLGLRNVGSLSLLATAPDGRQVELATGRTMNLVTGARISAGALDCDVVAVDSD